MKTEGKKKLFDRFEFIICSYQGGGNAGVRNNYVRPALKNKPCTWQGFLRSDYLLSLGL